MSTVKADNFTWKTGEATAQVGSSVTGPQIVYGVAKVWCNFNGTGTIATRASFNVSSLTDNGTGDYSVNFTNSLIDTNYCCGPTGNYDSSNYAAIGEVKSRATGSLRFELRYPGNNTAYDMDECNMAAYR